MKSSKTKTISFSFSNKSEFLVESTFSPQIFTKLKNKTKERSNQKQKSPNFLQDFSFLILKYCELLQKETGFQKEKQTNKNSGVVPREVQTFQHDFGSSRD